MKIKIEVWSDVACPFCYIGKKNLDTALSTFEHKDSVEIEWRSFQLDPEAEKNPRHTTFEMLAKKYNRSLPQIEQMVSGVRERGKDIGITIDSARSIPANTFHAHRLLHYAQLEGLQSEAHERLFNAYHSEGLHFGDLSVLQKLGEEIGLPSDDVKKLLSGNDYSERVSRDIEEAHELGINGVPFFLFNRKFVVPGAQPVETFIEALKKSVL